MAETTQELLKVYVRILRLYCALFFPPPLISDRPSFHVGEPRVFFPLLHEILTSATVLHLKNATTSLPVVTTEA